MTVEENGLFQTHILERELDNDEMEESEREDIFSEDVFTGIQKQRMELEKVVSGIPEDELRRILVSLAWEESAFYNYLMIKYVEKIDSRQMLRLKQEIDEIPGKYSDEDGFIEWHCVADYVHEFMNFLDVNVKILIEKNYLLEAFELTNKVFHCVGNQDIENPDGIILWVADQCYDCWKKILDKCNEEQRKQMLEWFQEHQDGYVVGDMEEYIRDFFINELDNEKGCL